MRHSTVVISLREMFPDVKHFPSDRAWAALLASGFIFFVAAALGAAEATPSAEQIEFFEKSVRPVLVARCTKCHGEKKVEAGLRLDSKAGLAHGIEGAPVVVPGNVDGSRLIQVVRYDGDTQMPPEGKMPPAELAALERWVKQGAIWPGDSSPKPSTGPDKDWPARIAAAKATHWAFQPVRRPPLPQVANAGWCRTPIDFFILQKLEQAGLTPSPPADPRTLLRRVTYDLTGLPPTASDLDSTIKPRPPVAENDDRDHRLRLYGDDYTAVIDALLASPHYGQRWGRHWLDIARYADTKGYAFQQERRYPYAYTYRDYVIDAFNDDLPFDQFVTEQLAADLLPQRTDRRHLAALGFLTVGRRIGVHDDIDDRIDVVGRGLLGLSIGCARCHDHKYDAIPAEDYYSLYGVFRSSTEPSELPLLGTPEPSEEYHRFQEELNKRQGAYDAALAKEVAKLSDELRTHVGDFLAAVIVDARGKGKLEPYPYAVAEPRAAVMRHWKEYLKHSLNKPHGVFSAWHRFAGLPTESFAADADRFIADLRAGQEKMPVNPRLRAELLKSPPAKPLDVARLYDGVLEAVRREWNDAVAAAAKEKRPTPTRFDDPAAEELRQVLYGPASPAVLTADQADGLFDRGVDIRLTPLKKKVDEWLATGAGAPPRAMVLVEGNPFQPYVFLRGNPGLRGKSVPRQFVGLASPDERKPFPQGSGRLDLARAIVDPRNPLTARVIVNRVWQHHFGQGLVRTPSDFGVRGEPPTHPELLDYLATWFVDHGWSLKQLHRLILRSAVYQQSSIADCGLRIADPEEIAVPATRNLASNPQSAIANPQLVDPDNRLLWRMNRRRLEFEAIRDSMLVAADRLDQRMKGRADELTATPFPTRRTVYAYVDRQDLPELFRTFDFASPDVSTEQRPQTTVPQQALFEMNSPFVIEQARSIARRADARTPMDDGEKIAAMYRFILAREPDAAEIAVARRFIAQAAEQPPAVPIWQYGYGSLDADGRVGRFVPFKHFTGNSWQVGPAFPDPKLGHVALRAGGGHPGKQPDAATILRWTAPCDGAFLVEGTLEHGNDKGDGIRATISTQKGTIVSASVFRGKIATNSPSIEMRAGDAIDLVVDCRGDTNSDSYTWRPVIREIGGGDRQWSAETDFRGPPSPPLTSWEMLAQVLLLTNEAMFVD